MEFTVKSLNISDQKGTTKHPVHEITLNENGIIGDAHSGDWHRQVSLLAIEQINTFSDKYKKEFKAGDFAENITTEGIDFTNVKILDILENESVKLMITQKGKKCHGGGCTIFTSVGQCVMPKEGIFSRVLKYGTLKPGDKMLYKQKIFKVAVITLSDRASRGEYEDLSGPVIKDMISTFFMSIGRKSEITGIIIPDDSAMLKKSIIELSDSFDIVFTTGGTGISYRDITIETITPMLDKQIPGITEMIRIKYGMENPKALLSRSVAGSIGRMLIFCLPGSPKAVREYITEINKVLEHLIYMLNGLDNH